MTPTELDRFYTALSDALGRVGEHGAPLFLATLVLDVVVAHVPPADALDAVERAERLAGL